MDIADHCLLSRDIYKYSLQLQDKTFFEDEQLIDTLHNDNAEPKEHFTWAKKDNVENRNNDDKDNKDEDKNTDINDSSSG